MYCKLLQHISCYKGDNLSTENVIRTVLIAFAKFGLPKKIALYAGIIFIIDKLRQIYRQLSMQQDITSSLYHKSNRQIRVHKINKAYC